MKIMKPFGAAACVALLATASASVAQTRGQCLSSEEAGGLVTYALPSAIEGLSRQCAKSLPATAALIQGGPIMAARYRVEADKAWPVARLAFDKIAGSQLSDIVGPDAARTLVDGLLGTAVAQRIKPDDCQTVDRLVNVLEPLPARNMADLILVLMDIGAKNDPKGGPFNICKAQRN